MFLPMLAQMIGIFLGATKQTKFLPSGSEAMVNLSWFWKYECITIPGK